MSADTEQTASRTSDEIAADDAVRGALVRKHVRRILLALQGRIRQNPRS